MLHAPVFGQAFLLQRRKEGKSIYIVFILLGCILLICSSIILFALYYLKNVLQVLTFSQILYNINFGLEGTSEEVWQGAIQAYFHSNWIFLVLCLAINLAIMLGFFFWLRHARERARQERKETGLSIFETGHLPGAKKLKSTSRKIFWISAALFVIDAAVFCGCSYYALDSLGYFSYRQKEAASDQFYQKYYTKPSSSLLTFPDNPKNVMILWLESMEISLADKAHGGHEEISRIPFLEQLALDNVNFAKEGDIGGAYMTSNTSFTIAGMIAESAGIPLCYHGEGIISDWKEGKSFLPGAVSLGDLLEEQGYKNMLRLGSDAAYSGRENYFSQHGNFQIEDYQDAIEDELIPKDYFVNWGYEDQKLFEFAKEDLTELSQSDRPFCYTLLTVDTHFPDGYLCENCPDIFEDQIDNVYACTDDLIEKFLGWCQKQDWYENTVVMLCGDHLSMAEDISLRTADYDRKVYFTLLNAPKEPEAEREFMTMDLFPTLLSAMGIEIQGDRLGLGTNLYSDKETLIEQMGLEEVNEELNSTQSYYTEEIMGLDPEDLP